LSPGEPIVAHYIGAFSRLTETFIYEQLQAQRAEGLDVRVLTHERLASEARPFPEVRIVPRPPRLSPQAGAARLRRLLGSDPSWNSTSSRMTRALRSEGATVLHAHFGWSGTYSMAAASRAGIPLVTTFYGRDAAAHTTAADRRRLQSLFRRSARVLVLSEQMAGRLDRLGCARERITVHHLGIDTDAFPFLAPSPPGPGETVRLVSVGRLVEKKGMDVLLGALARLRDGGSSLRLSIVGGGPEEAGLRRLAGELGVTDRVELLGALPREETLRRMREAHLFVLASRIASDGDAEGTPTVLLEAQALGLPLVSTLHEGIPECLPRENRGCLAPEGDPDELAERIRALIQDPDGWEEIARRGRAHVEEEFDSRRLAARARELYREVCAAPAAS
jgi:glycosyltransferase involved in cell wall biosynthesis